MNETIHIQDSKKGYKVRVNCMTFNQAAYITDALNGFVMQQTDFPFVCIIVDDASTDGEPEVIKKYLEERFDKEVLDIQSPDETDEYIRVFARHKENRNCYFLVLFLKYNHYSIKKPKLRSVAELINTISYIAFCEGDDYWTDPLKLQKQVNYLEEHSDYSMCFHAAKVLNQGVNVERIGARCEHVETRDYFSTEVFGNWIVPTASIVYRKEMVDRFRMKHSEWLTRGDIALVLRCTHTGKVRGMSDVMSVYRMQPNSVSHNSNHRGREVFKLPNHFKCIYINFPQVDKDSVKWSVSHAYYSRMKQQKSILRRICDFILCAYWDPKYAIEKSLKMINRKK